jgi:hypothetical protein
LRHRERDDDQHRGDREGGPHAASHGRGRRRREVGRRRGEGEHGTQGGGAGDEPEVARQVEQAGNDAPLLRADIGHDGRVVGRLEGCVAGGDDDDGSEVSGDAERRGHHAEGAGTGRHRAESDDGQASGAETVRQPAGRHAGQRCGQRTGRQVQPHQSRVEPECAREVERPDHQRRHHHCRDERAHGEAGTQRGIAKHRQAEQR